MAYSPTVHTSKMNKIKQKSHIKDTANYNNNISNTGKLFDKIRSEELITDEQEEFSMPVKDIKTYADYMNDNAKVYDKETGEYLISALNCNSVVNVVSEFQEIEKLYHSHKRESGINKDRIPNQAFRLYINFNGKEVPPKKVHQISTEIARRICGEEFKALISTHTNTEHYHSHILINAYNNDGWHKLKDEYFIGLKWQNISNMVALENGYEILFTPPTQQEEKENENDEILNNENLINNEKRKIKIEKLTKENYEKFNKQIGKLKLQNTINAYLTKENIEKYNIKNFNDLKNILYKNHKYTCIRNKNDKQNEWYQEDSNFTFGKHKDKKTGEWMPNNFITERRLGKQYTEKYLNSYIKFIRNDNELEYKIKNIKKSEVFNFNQYNNTYFRDKIMTFQKPFLIMLLCFIINIIKFIIEYQKQIEITNAEKINIVDLDIKLLKQQQESIKKTIEQVIIYNNDIKENKNQNNYTIENEEDLKIAKFKYLKELKQLQYKKYNKQNKTQINNLINAINTIYEKKEIIDKFKLTQVFNSEIGESNILENLAKLDPLQPKTKGLLYRNLKDSNFILKYSYNEITESQARAINQFIYNIKSGTICPTTEKEYIDESGTICPTNPLRPPYKYTKSGTICPTPDILYTKAEFVQLKKENKLYKPSKYSIKQDNLKQQQQIYNDKLSQYKMTEEEYKEIPKIRLAINRLKSFGIKDFNETELNNLYDKLNDMLDIDIKNQDRINELKDNLKLINKLEYFSSGEYTENYKPLKNLINQDALTKIHNIFIKRFKTDAQQLNAIKNILENNYDELRDILNNDNSLITAPLEFKMILKHIYKLNDTDITEEEINNLDIQTIKNAIIDYLNEFDINNFNNTINADINTREMQENINIQNDIEEEKSLTETQEEINEKTKEVKRNNIYNLFK